LEAIRILLAFAASKGFKLFQMDVKSGFLNGKERRSGWCLGGPATEAQSECAKPTYSLD
jgi:hypothetical protein